MANYNIGLSADKKTVYVSVGADALPGAATNVLADFKHDDVDDNIDTYEGNHVLYHHVRDALYHEGIMDMQSIKIATSGALAAEFLTAAALNIVGTGNATIVIEYQPADVNAVNSDFTYVSSDVTKATVNAAGVVTGVAAGSVSITATSKTTGKVVLVAVTVTTE